MADGNQPPNAWPLIPYAWKTNFNSALSEQNYRNAYAAQFGDNRKARRGANGRIFYPTANGTNMLPTVPGSDPYHKQTQVEGLPGLVEKEIPNAEAFRKADQVSVDPWQRYYTSGDPGPYQGANWQVSDMRPGARLARAASVDAFNNSHDVDPGKIANLQGLRSGSEVMSDMAYRLSRINDGSLSGLSQLQIDLGNANAHDLAQAGVKPDTIAFINDLRRAKEQGLFLPPTGSSAEKSGGSGESMFSHIIASSPQAAAWAGLGSVLDKGWNAVTGWLSRPENLAALRNTAPQDLNKVNQTFYDTVRQDPQGRWPSDLVDQANRIGQHPGFSYGGNPYSESKPLPNPPQTEETLGTPPTVALPSQSTPQQQAPGTPSAPAQPAQPAQPGAAPITQLPRVTVNAQAPTTQPQVDPNTPLGQRLLQTLGHFFTFSLGRHGQPQQTPQAQPSANVSMLSPSRQPTTAPTTATQRPAQTTRADQPPPAPVQNVPRVVYSGDPETNYPNYTPTPPTPERLLGMPIPPHMGEGQDVTGGATSSATPARGQPQLVAATHQDHVDALEPGTAFTWPDGNTYVKTG